MARSSIVGYRRFEGLQATRELARLYASTRLFVNFFQPSFKLKEKHRDGAKVIKRYHRPATPCQRLLADPRTPEETRRQLTALSLTLDPVLLLRDIRLAQERLVTIADTPGGRSLPTTARCLLRPSWKACGSHGAAVKSAPPRAQSLQLNASAADLIRCWR